MPRPRLNSPGEIIYVCLSLSVYVSVQSGVSLMHKILHFGSFSIKITPQKLISAFSQRSYEKTNNKYPVSLLNSVSEVVLTKLIMGFPWL